MTALNFLYLLTYVGTVVVGISALIRSANVPGLQWWAYVGYTINSVIIIAYTIHTKEYSLLINQSLLMCTNTIGLVRWWGK